MAAGYINLLAAVVIREGRMGAESNVVQIRFFK